MGFRPNVLISLMQFGLMGKRTVDCCGIVAMGRLLYVGRESVVVDRSLGIGPLWVGCYGLAFVGRF